MTVAWHTFSTIAAFVVLAQIGVLAIWLVVVAVASAYEFGWCRRR